MNLLKTVSLAAYLTLSPLLYSQNFEQKNIDLPFCQEAVSLYGQVISDVSSENGLIDFCLDNSKQGVIFLGEDENPTNVIDVFDTAYPGIIESLELIIKRVDSFNVNGIYGRCLANRSIIEISDYLKDIKENSGVVDIKKTMESGVNSFDRLFYEILLKSQKFDFDINYCPDLEIGERVDFIIYAPLNYSSEQVLFSAIGRDIIERNHVIAVLSHEIGHAILADNNNTKFMKQYLDLCLKNNNVSCYFENEDYIKANNVYFWYLDKLVELDYYCLLFELGDKDELVMINLNEQNSVKKKLLEFATMLIVEEDVCNGIRNLICGTNPENETQKKKLELIDSYLKSISRIWKLGQENNKISLRKN